MMAILSGRRPGVVGGLAGLALAAMLVTAACSDDQVKAEPSSDPSPTARLTEDLVFAEADEFARQFAATPTATPTAVPRPTPTPTPTPVPTPVPTPILVAEAEARSLVDDPSVPAPTLGVAVDAVDDPSGASSESIANLRPFAPQGWEQPLVIAPTAGQNASRPVTVQGDQFISFGVANLGSIEAGPGFFVDLYFDEYLVQRFPMRVPLGAGRFVSWDDFEHLAQLVRLEPGKHTLKIVIDATGLVRESDESDNVYEATFDWGGVAGPSPVAGTGEGEKGVNLTFFSPSEWGSALVAGAFEKDLEIERNTYLPAPTPLGPLGGPLSVESTTFVAYAITNSGLLSHPGDVLVDLYLDDTLVLRDSWSRLISQQRVHRSPWGALGDVIRLEPGIHTLKIVVDPNNLVAETDESDNVFSRRFEWSSEPIDPSDRPVGDPVVPDVPDVLLLPNLVPGWLWERDGPIVLDTVPRTTVDGPLWLGASVYTDVVVYNQSVVPVDQDFVVDIFFDDVRVHIVDLAGPSPARSFRVIEDWSGLLRNVDITPGAHVLRMVIDPDDRVRESDETDNVYEKRFFWSETAEPAPAATTYSEPELREALASLPDLLDSQGPVLADDGTGNAERVLRIADAGFFLVTGSSFRDERVTIRLLSRPQYLGWIDDTYAELFAVDDGTSYEALARTRERDRNISLAKKQRRFGVIEIAVDGSHSFADVLNSLVHELGHALQDRLNPSQTESPDSLELSAIREAEAQQFERVFWLAVEEFTGRRYTRYPGYEGYLAFIDTSFRSDVETMGQSEHALGRLVQWLAVLADPNLAGLRSELARDGALSRQSAFALYLYLVNIEPVSAIGYVRTLVSGIGPALPEIAAVAVSRLEDLASPMDEGSPYLRQPALLSP